MLAAISAAVSPETIEAGSGMVALEIITVPDVLVNGVAESAVPLLKSKFYSSFILHPFDDLLSGSCA
jgi:hypothetical protein